MTNMVDVRIILRQTLSIPHDTQGRSKRWKHDRIEHYLQKKTRRNLSSESVQLIFTICFTCKISEKKRKKRHTRKREQWKHTLHYTSSNECKDLKDSWRILLATSSASPTLFIWISFGSTKHIFKIRISPPNSDLSVQIRGEEPAFFLS